MDKRRRGLYAVIAAVVALAVVAVVWVLVTRASAVAIVNGERISKRDFIARMEDAAGYNVLDQMITEALIRQAAAKAGITVSKDRVEEELNSIRQQFGSSFDSVLWQYGMTEDDLRKNIEMNLLVMEYSTKDLTITDEDLRKYFEEHKDQYNTPEMGQGQAHPGRDRGRGQGDRHPARAGRRLRPAGAGEVHRHHVGDTRRRP